MRNNLAASVENDRAMRQVPRTRSALWMSLGCAVLGASALHFYLARYERDVGGAPKSVLVVTRDLALGDVITHGALDVRELPERYVEERHISFEDLERVLGARVTSALASGTALLWSDLDVAHETRTLAGLVRDGMRAFPLPDRDVTFDGLLRPGDRVDVLFTPEAESEQASALLENVLVLTVGRDLGRPQERAADALEHAGRVTLSVTLAQAQRLAAREGHGSLRLALRNPQDLTVSDVAEQPQSRQDGVHLGERGVP